MGNVVSATGWVKMRMMSQIKHLEKSRGGLAIGTVGANAVFAAITGISIASAGSIYKNCSSPYDKVWVFSKVFSWCRCWIFSSRNVIPPSLLLILYGILTEQSIGDLFIAAIIPGILLAIVFGFGIFITKFFLEKNLFIFKKENSNFW